MSLAKVRTLAPSGATATMRWLNELGPVNGLRWSTAMPGGYDQMSCNLIRPPTYRTEAMNAGRITQITYAASTIWEGKLDEGQPGDGGWAMTAHGSGALATEWDAIYSTWSDQNDDV